MPHDALAPILLTGFTLGLLHGVTPDEHTWPITFSYAIGRHSARGGAVAGLLFSLSFTVQRALASELSYFALLPVERLVGWQFYIYVLVGAVMLVSGRYALRGRLLHLFDAHLGTPDHPQALPTYMPLVHGFIAGWGTGAFAITTYTVLVPATHSPWLAFLPGVLFGAGTMVAQIFLGSLVGAWMAKRRLGERARTFVARQVAGRTLAWGGAAFMVVGAVGIWRPALVDWQVATGLPFAHLQHLDSGFFLAIAVLLLIAGVSLVQSLHEAGRRYGDR